MYITFSMADKSNEDSVTRPKSPVAGPTQQVTKKKKIDVLLKATGDAPIMKQKKWAVEPTKTIAGIVDFIRKYIKCDPAESLFIYVNQAFSPSPDQTIKNLFECFGSDGKLVLHYCKSEAWG